MHFIIFLLIVWSLGFFYRWEHRSYRRGLAVLAAHLRAHPGDIPAGSDWRITRRQGGAVYLKRRFHVATAAAAARYAVPVAAFWCLLLGLHSWPAALAYLALTCLKWFALATVLEPAENIYSLRLGGLVLFSEGLG
jgi:hypothetical protein